MGQQHPKSTCCFPGCTRWSRLYAPGQAWLCGPRGCWVKIARPSRLLLKAMWRRMRALWPADVAWDDLPGWKQDAFRRLDKLERRVWERALRRAVLKEAGL